jgi:hypothetical protein
MGFNSAFKGLIIYLISVWLMWRAVQFACFIFHSNSSDFYLTWYWRSELQFCRTNWILILKCQCLLLCIVSILRWRWPCPVFRHIYLKKRCKRVPLSAAEGGVWSLSFLLANLLTTHFKILSALIKKHVVAIWSLEVSTFSECFICGYWHFINI